MFVNGKPQRSIWQDRRTGVVQIIDQTQLPHKLKIVELICLNDAVKAIAIMQVRGAPLIGATAAYGIALAMDGQSDLKTLQMARQHLYEARPTAVNLRWALDRMQHTLDNCSPTDWSRIAWQEARRIADEDVATNSAIGDNGCQLLREISEHKPVGEPINILTHCNAGWLATVDWGTALAPIYKAHDAGLNIHVWVDETRPRNQGASLTTWELSNHGVANTLIVDNAGGHLMQRGQVDLCIVGSDRTTLNGDVCNKIGTYLKALAAFDNQVPFYVALPRSTVDSTLEHGMDIPIEERGGDEVTKIQGQRSDGIIDQVSLVGINTLACNPAFDVTPARLISGYICETGVSNEIKTLLN
ncbi:MAG: methylthioribose-1-phosphate isomerase [Parasphingorhabdus sp.]